MNYSQFSVAQNSTYYCMFIHPQPKVSALSASAFFLLSFPMQQLTMATNYLYCTAAPYLWAVINKSYRRNLTFCDCSRCERHLFLKSNTVAASTTPVFTCSCTKHYCRLCVGFLNIQDFRHILPFPQKSSILFQTMYKSTNDRSRLQQPLDTCSFSAVVLGVKQTGENLIHNIQ